MRPKVLVLIGCFAALAPAVARADLAAAPMQLSLEVTTDSLSQECRRLHTADTRSVATVPLRRTFNDDFDEHPLSAGAGCRITRAARPGPMHATGAATVPTSSGRRANGEQQIYVDPRYAGRATEPLGLDPFRVKNGVLSIVASRTPPDLKPVLFNNEYISGVLTTQGTFSQKYGYFEIRAKIPVGQGVWPAFWMLADDGGWPPEIDVMEGRGERPGDMVMTTHWRIAAERSVQSCGFDFTVGDASTTFHNYGVLWEEDRLVYFIDRGPVSDIKVPVGFDDPMYMIVNLAIGSKIFGSRFRRCGDAAAVAFEIDRISAYQIDMKARRRRCLRTSRVAPLPGLRASLRSA